MAGEHISGHSGGGDPGRFETRLRVPGGEGLMGVVDVDGHGAPVPLAVRRETVELAPGMETEMLAYRFDDGERRVLNPVFRVRRGARFAAELTNHLAEGTTVHWHGLHVDWRVDGHPSLSVAPGASHRYDFRVANRAGLYWYHPHAHEATARQTYLGLAGLFVVEDEDDARLNEALGLRFGKTDLPLLLQDKTFEEDGSLPYAPDPMSRSMGVTGDSVMVNMTPNPRLEVSAGPHRFRLLNGSNARVYRLAFAEGSGGPMPLWLVGTDGGLLERPVRATEVFLSPGERADVVVDLSPVRVGGAVSLKSLAFDPMHNEMDHDSGMHHPGATLGDGAEFDVLKLSVATGGEGGLDFPEPLSSLVLPEGAGSPARGVDLSVQDGGGHELRWLMGGRAYDPDDYPITVRRGDTEVWELRNAERSMPHPMHLHGFQFRVLGRTGSPKQVRRLAVDTRGRIATDLGPKDTVLVWPGESVTIATDFSHDFDGEQRYLFHCHILEHEDSGMMLNYRVV